MTASLDNIVGVADVATRLGVTAERVRQLDATLRPRLIGRTRVYDGAAIERYAVAREAERDAKAAAR